MYRQKPSEWEEVGKGFAGLAGAATFVGAWWYCATSYGFLFGFGLGWLPAGILAVMVGGMLAALWPLALILAGVGLFIGLASVASCALA